MSLASLQMFPRGADGWGSGPLTFGRCTTLLLGSNGAGKTPLLKALAYCLGQPVELPPLIIAKCKSVTLEINTAGGLFTVDRKLSDDVDVAVTSPAGFVETFRDERSFSAWMLPVLGLPPRFLSGHNRERIPPYMSIVGPTFLVDQDTGWTMPYVPFESHRFLKDQTQEILRWVLDIPVKHLSVDRTEYRQATVSQGAVQDQIALKRRSLEALQTELGEDALPDASERLLARRVALEFTMQSRYSVLESLTRIDTEFDARIRDASTQRDAIHFSVENVRRRIDQLADVQREVGAEIGALEENELAAGAFRHYCGNENCQFFRRPEESYGRRVLYLKDQLKDFETGASQAQRELALLQSQLESSNIALHQAIETKRASLGQSAGGAAVQDVRALSTELADIQQRIARIGLVAAERAKLEILIESEARATATVANLRPSGGARRDNSRLLDARAVLAEKFSEWIVALRTPNVGGIAIDDELRLSINNERFAPQSSHSGSTRTRIVLAFHAALIQTSVILNGKHPPLLILDAPKQHELSTADLNAFVRQFYGMFSAGGSPVQLVLSATDGSVVPSECADVIWEPPFLFDEGWRFLGPFRSALPSGPAATIA